MVSCLGKQCDSSILLTCWVCVRIEMKKHPVPGKTVGEPRAKTVTDIEQMGHVDFINFVFCFSLSSFYRYSYLLLFQTTMELAPSAYTPFRPAQCQRLNPCQALICISQHVLTDRPPDQS